MEVNQTPSLSEEAPSNYDYDCADEDYHASHSVRATESDSDFELLIPHGTMP